MHFFKQLSRLGPLQEGLGLSPALWQVRQFGATGCAGEKEDTVFTGTADVRTDKAPEDVATDSTRRWVSGDDLGTHAEAALDKAAEAIHKPGRTTGSEQQPEAAAEALANDEACHPADPYCSVGEEAPRPDDFHEEGDGSTPPSAGFPA